MLGRPEPLYTYNNSTRSGSISFYVLTDFAQNVELGIDYESETLASKSYSFDGIRFTGRDARTFQSGGEGKATYSDDRTKNLEAKKQELQDKISAMALSDSAAIIANSELSDEGMVTSTDASGNTTVRSIDFYQVISPEFAQSLRNRHDADKMQTQINTIELQLTAERERQSGFVRLAESNESNGNVYDEVLGKDYWPNDSEDGRLHKADALSLADTKERLDSMKQGLRFQPAFFSGDKTDFISRMTFLSRMTKPTKNEGDRGFSFTKPPVCHMRLGDYIHHDVVITSISKDYSDSIWCLETGEVQPMWCQITMSFNVVGQYNANGAPLTASDSEGYYDQKGSKSLMYVAPLEYGSQVPNAGETANDYYDAAKEGKLR